MLTPEQLESVEKAIAICERNHKREVCGLIKRISDYEPQSRIGPSQYLEGYLSHLGDALHRFEGKLTDEAIRVTRIVCPVLSAEEKSRITEVCELSLNAVFYENRFQIFCDAIIRHFSRFGIRIDLDAHGVNRFKARHHAGVKNKLREINGILDTELSLLISNHPKHYNEVSGSWLNELLQLKPNFFGIGINLNYLISKFLRRKR